MMQSFWLWFAFIFISWLLGLELQGFQTITTVQWLSSFLFWMLFFSAPLVRNRPGILTAFLIGCVVSISLIFLQPGTFSTYNPFSLLLILAIVGKAAVRLSGRYLWIFLVSAISFSLFVITTYTNSLPFFFVAVLFGLTCTALISFRGIFEKKELLEEQHSALLTEYRRIKRLEATGQAEARHEERARIAEELHDSLGHKLTSLMMQLEVLRLQSKSENEGQILYQLKQLAEESLAETRQAVSIMHEADTQGIPAIIDLIRKLEAETHVNISFHIEQGVLALKLNNEQSIALYRAIQEGITNSLKHGSKRQVDIRLKAPSGKLVRFELTNAVNGEQVIRPGFGLQAMRKRIEGLGGMIQFMQAGSSFYLQGSIPLGGGMSYDSNLISGGSGDGPSRVKDDD